MEITNSIITLELEGRNTAPAIAVAPFAVMKYVDVDDPMLLALSGEREIIDIAATHDAIAIAEQKVLAVPWFLRLEEGAFATIPSDSINYVLMENTDKAMVVPLDPGWSDVGA